MRSVCLLEVKTRQVFRWETPDVRTRKLHRAPLSSSLKLSQLKKLLSWEVKNPQELLDYQEKVMSDYKGS